MKRLIAILILAAGLPAASSLAAPGDAQNSVREDIRAGNVRTLREIEQSVLPKMQGMQYLGPEYDPTALVYRLKFIRDGRVVFVDVNARNGQVIRQSR